MGGIPRAGLSRGGRDVPKLIRSQSALRAVSRAVDTCTHSVLTALRHVPLALNTRKEYYNECRPHQRLSGAKPATVYRGQTWQKPERSAKQVTGPIRLRHFREQRITVYELAA